MNNHCYEQSNILILVVIDEIPEIRVEKGYEMGVLWGIDEVIVDCNFLEFVSVGVV